MEETKYYILKLQTDSKEYNNEAMLDYVLNKETGKNILAYSFKEVEIPKLDEDK